MGLKGHRLVGRRFEGRRRPTRRWPHGLDLRGVFSQQNDVSLKADNSPKAVENDCLYFTMRGGSLKNIAKNIIPKVPTNKNV